MRSAQYRNDCYRNGVISILVIMLLVIFATLAIAFAANTTLEVQKAANFQEVMKAQLAAESGLIYAIDTLDDFTMSTAPTASGDLSEAVYLHLSNRMDQSALLAGRSVSLAANDVVSVPEIALGTEQGNFSIAFYPIDESTYRLTVVGSCGEVSRSVALDLEVVKDTTVLKYSVASRSRTIIRGNVQVDGAITSTWTRTDDASPFDIDLGAEADISGGIKTVLSQEEFEQAGCDQDIVDDVEMGYDEPPFAEYTTEDFDTSSYRSLAPNTLPAPDYTQTSGFPETNPARQVNRSFYVGNGNNTTVFHDVTISANKNAYFKNCIFQGYTYIEVPNNVVFEDCTFHGPIITGVPNDFQWTTNSLYFKGDTTINNHVMPESTILAPNFNVNIGDFSKDNENSSSKITGVLVGGIVDIRDNALIEGTILSMSDLDNIGSSNAWLYGTNLGYWEHDAEESGGALPETTNIRIVPQPNAQLPYGMNNSKYVLSPNAGTYSEQP